MSSHLILDAHLNFFDIILTAIWARTKYPHHKIYLPIVGYSFYVPLMREVVRYLQKQYTLEFLPVYRKIELNPTNPLMMLLSKFYPQGITPELRQKANEQYINTCIIELAKGNCIVIVSPYGGPTYYGKKIKYGVRKIMEQSPQTLITKSRLKLIPLHHTTIYKKYHQKQPLAKQFKNL